MRVSYEEERTPLNHRLRSDVAGLLVMLGVFYLLLGVWCYIGHVITRHPLVAQVLAHYSHIIVPFVLIGLGIYILIESSTPKLLGF
jgi:cadmium resistance protein CadD (predicted permease)